MGFLEVRPNSLRVSKDYLSDKIKISFPLVNDVQIMFMHLGKNLAKKYDLKKGDRIILLIDENNPCIWQIKKDINGFKLGLHGGGNNLKLQIVWRNREIPNGVKSPRFVNVKKSGGNIEITF